MRRKAARLDDRESASETARCLADLKDVKLVVMRLACGDYVVNDRVVVERKTLADFAASLIDGRLFKQAGLLAASCWLPAYLLEGVVMPGGVSREALQGALISLRLMYGIPVLRAADAVESVRLMQYIGNQMSRATTQALPRPGYRPRSKRKRQLFILQGLPGIGPNRAARLSDFFGNIQAIVSADVRQLAAVAGIGPATAAAIREALT